MAVTPDEYQAALMLIKSHIEKITNSTKLTAFGRDCNETQIKAALYIIESTIQRARGGV